MFIRYLVIVMMVLAAGCNKAPGEGGHGGGMGAFAVPVVGMKVVGQQVFEKISVVGSLAANEWVEVKSQIDSMVTDIRFEEGQRVKRGDTLLVLDRQKLEASLAQAKANFDIAQTTFNRMQALVKHGAVSKQEFDQAQAELAAKRAQTDLIAAELTDTVITAPFDAVTGERKVSLGQVINREKILTVLIDESQLKVDFQLPERYVALVAPDQEIELSVDAYPKEVFKGKVYFINPQVEAATRTFLVKARIDNPQGRLRSGMFAQLQLIVSERPQALMVPESALIPKGDMVSIFTIDKDNKAQLAAVTVGLRQAGQVEILTGLNAGDTVITEGYQKIGPGSLVSLGDQKAKDDAQAAKKEE